MSGWCEGELVGFAHLNEEQSNDGIEIEPHSPSDLGGTFLDVLVKWTIKVVSLDMRITSMATVSYSACEC